jgi:hypothetical protein
VTDRTHAPKVPLATHAPPPAAGGVLKAPFARVDGAGVPLATVSVAKVPLATVVNDPRAPLATAGSVPRAPLAALVACPDRGEP